MQSFVDRNRNIIFKPGIRVHWFIYSHDGIILQGGFGTIIELSSGESTYTYGFEVCTLLLLCDDGVLRKIPYTEVDLLEDWD